MDYKAVRRLERVESTAVRPGQETLVSYSVPWLDMALTDFLRRFSKTARVYWESASVAFAGAGRTALLTADGPQRFDSIRLQAKQLFGQVVRPGGGNVPPSVGPRLVGGFAFDADFEAADIWDGFAAATFILPRYQLTQVEGKSWLTLNRLVGAQGDDEQIVGEMYQEIKMVKSSMGKSLENGRHGNVSQQLDIDYPMSPEQWQRIVSDATTRIRAGELEKTVLARSCAVTAGSDIDPLSILTHLKANYPYCYHFLIEPSPGHAFYGATPELLIEINDAKLNAVALAGSIRRGASSEEDIRLGNEMMANPKERHEQALVVQKIEERLQGLTSELEVSSEPVLFKLKNIQHLRTDIRGKLAEGQDILSAVETLHPTPAVGGTPQKIALQLINEGESVARGWYAAPVGWINERGDGLFAVAIRSAVSAGNEARLYAGAGIVADSVPESEWQETQLKFKPLLDALEGTIEP